MCAARVSKKVSQVYYLLGDDGEHVLAQTQYLLRFKPMATSLAEDKLFECLLEIPTDKSSAERLSSNEAKRAFEDLHNSFIKKEGESKDLYKKLEEKIISLLLVLKVGIHK